MKRIFSALLAVAMLLTLGLTAFAAGTDGKITINNAVNNETYNAYRVFDLDYTGTNVTYTYTVSDAADAFLTELQKSDSPFSLAQIGSTDDYIVTKKDDAAGDTISAWLKSKSALLPNALAPVTASGNKAEWTDVQYGYYYISTSVGSAVVVNSTMKNISVDDKNSIPGVDKKQSKTNASGYADTELSVSIGDTVYYEVTVTDGKSTDKAITLTDTMSAGLTNNKEYTLYKNTVADANKLTADSDYTVDRSENNGFKITVKADCVAVLGENDKIILRYSAKINENAVTKSENGDNRNTVTMQYSQQTTTDSVDVTTCKIQIVKYNTTGNALLDGAKFRIYDAAAGGNEIKVVADGDNYRVDTTAVSGVDIVAGVPVIKGLAEGTYYLQEIEAPRGFNPLTSRKEFVVNGDNLAAVTATAYTDGGVGVGNSAGSTLPTTGGAGTALLITFGAMTVLIAGVFLVTNKRMKKELL